MTADIKAHIVTVSLPAWGHTKPLCALVARLMRIKRLHATIITSTDIQVKVQNEVERQFTPEESALKQLVRVVGLPCSPIPFQYQSYEAAVVEVYKDLSAGKPVKSTPDSETIYNAVPAPSLVVLDFFCNTVLKGVRATTGKTVPVYAWQSGAATAILRLFGPEYLGGIGDLVKKIEEIKADSEENRIKQMKKMFECTDGEVMRLPGLPDMYDYELYPQQTVPFPDKEFVEFHAHVFRLFEESDGVLMSTSTLYEGGCLEGWQKWLGQKPVHWVGALSPPASAEEIMKEKTTPEGKALETFLDNMLDKHGSNSVVYISFGTVWWPADPAKIFAVVEELLDEGIPFVLSHASPFAVIPDEFLKKIESSGIGHHATWIPQQVILRHNALGWFMSHCGHNSVMESLSAGVPLICWPFMADQPINATLISWQHGAGYELFEVRSGHGLQPVLRLGGKKVKGTPEAVKAEIRAVMKSAKGYEGDLKRSKAQWFAKHFAAAFEEGGAHYEAMKKLRDAMP